MDSGGPSLLPKILIIVFLTALNAFFASAEMAMVSSNKNKIQTLADEGNKKAKALLRVTSDQTRFLSTIQVGITLANLFSSASAATSLSPYLAMVLVDMGIPYASTISLALITILLSFITIIFGELVPKRIALQNAEKVGLASVRIIDFISKVTYPFVKFLSFSTTFVLKALGQYSEDVEERISEEELKSYIRVSQEQGVINLSGEEMIVKIMDFDDKMAHEIMTPRTSIYMIDYDEFDNNKINEILDSGFSRVPVFKEKADNIVGIIYLKDLFVEYSKNDYKSIDIDKVLKEPYFIPETKKIDSLLKELQNTKNYVAVLIDEYGGFSGIVTVEDIVEEIVGEIEDEYDKINPRMEKIGEDLYLVDGFMDIDDVNEELNIELHSDNHETISGLAVELLGYIPSPDQVGAVVNFENIALLKVLSVKDNRIEKIELKILEEESEEEDED
ncbi:hemolysin family protein [Anaerosphaera multitolerans]|uniref:HlyC/CorC family transporter n=1 Tax=Anaerosphaera multitolerans TaxID=2487351 RepID=A0A437S6K6_9FIRM|nr:hemolysin family protein [Anaerosphaera multitolerans]RVU54646.1 HlyC/CorC family transporter [Anaerosphaera multitolerans]